MIDSTTSYYFNTQTKHNIENAKDRWIPAKLNGHNVDISIIVFASLVNREGLNLKLFYFVSARFIYLTDNVFINNYYNEGVGLSEQSKDSDAILYFDEALKIAPKDINALYNRGVCKLKTGDKTGSCKDWQVIHDYGYNDADGLIQKHCNK